ncbi:hypothetical protein GGR52DRAFT_103046 [Hypoxylon sp. FL1284]|nr:hypothetical protein GGR52DRAFT_103046 [Hypoxylon sp. FL1284]
MRQSLLLPLLGAAGLSTAQTTAAPDTIPTILGIRGANSAGCFSATSVSAALGAGGLKFDFTDMRAAVAPADPFDSEAAVCIPTIELGAFPLGWRFSIAEATFTGHATLSGGARLESVAAVAYFQWEHLKNSAALDEPTVKNASGSYLMNMPEMKVDFGASGVYDKDFSINIPNPAPAWSPCFTGQEYSYDDKMQLQFQFQVYLTKEGYSKTGYGVFGRSTGPAMTANLKLVWEKCDPTKQTAWGQFRMGDYETCQRTGSTGTEGNPTVIW